MLKGNRGSQTTRERRREMTMQQNKRGDNIKITISTKDKSITIDSETLRRVVQELRKKRREERRRQ